VLRAFDEWWCAAYCDSPVDPRQASTHDVSLCTYERWFAAEPATDSYCTGGWPSVPEYVSRTAGIPHAHVRSLAAFRLGAHSFEVATGRWCNRPRSQHICLLCGTGLGDETHVVFECPCQGMSSSIACQPVCCVYPMSFWLPCGLLTCAEPTTVYSYVTSTLRVLLKLFETISQL